MIKLTLLGESLVFSYIKYTTKSLKVTMSITSLPCELWLVEDMHENTQEMHSISEAPKESEIRNKQWQNRRHI